MPHHKLSQILLKKAEQDIVVLSKWRTDYEIADEIFGFHAQHAAEKMLKASLAYQKIEITYSTCSISFINGHKNVFLQNKV